MTNEDITRTALVTGGSQGLGLALTTALVDRGWAVLTDSRHADLLASATAHSGATGVVGDVTDPLHRKQLVAEVAALGGLDLLVHNASTLGPLPMRPLEEYDDLPRALDDVATANAVAPLELTLALREQLRRREGLVVGITSDAAADHYPSWGPYGATKAMLEHLLLTFAAESGLTTYVVDPGDMRTAMHQNAFPGEDISDRPTPGSVLPALLALLEERPRPTGRYRATELQPATQQGS